MRVFKRLASDRSGNVTMIFAGALTMLIATAGLAVDAGTFFLEKRKLQGIADAAALAAVNDVKMASRGARQAIELNNGTGVRIDSITSGSYVSDATRSADARFDANGADKDAVRIALSRDVPNFFGQFLTGRSTTTIAAHSTAARMDMAGFSLGTRLSAIQGGLPNALLSGLVGTDLQLSVMDYNSLANAQVDILKFTEALRSTARLNVASFGEVLAAQVTLPQIANAMAAATSDPSAAALFTRIATLLPANRLSGDRIIDLGPLSANVRADPANPINADAYAMLLAFLEVGGQNHYVDALVDIGVPGVASSRVMLAIGARPVGSPWISVGAKDQVTIRTAQMRVYLESIISAAGLGQVRVPVFVELASAQARLDDVSCSGGPSHASATLAVTPSVGEVAIADFDKSSFANFSSTPLLKPAALIQLPGVSATAFADIKLGGVSPQKVSFSADDISEDRIRTVSTNDIAQGAVVSLVQGATVNVSALGGLNLPLLNGSLIGALLRPAAAPLDLLLDQIMSLAGVRVGQADARVNGVRCGTPMLVG